MRSGVLAVGLFAVLSVGVVSCARRDPDATPEGAVRELVLELKQVDGDPARAKTAFDRLSKDTRDNLVERAARYGDASGKRIVPEQMIAPASFIERFEARDLSATITGKYAIVHASGLLDGERAEIPCVYEDGAWRVHISLPPLSPVEMRPRDDVP